MSFGSAYQQTELRLVNSFWVKCFHWLTSSSGLASCWEKWKHFIWTEHCYVFTSETPAGVLSLPQAELIALLIYACASQQPKDKDSELWGLYDLHVLRRFPEPWLQSDVAEGMTTVTSACVKWPSSIHRCAPSLHLITFNKQPDGGVNIPVCSEHALHSNCSGTWWQMHEE